jgi:hypothetical protein
VTDSDDHLQTILTLQCPPDDVIVECGESTDPDATGYALANGYCPEGGPYVSYTDEEIPGTCDGEWTIIRTWVATDDCGSYVTCTQIITIVDTTAPIVICEDVVSDCEDKSCLTFDEISVDPYGPPVVVNNVDFGGVTINIKGYKKGGAQGQVVLFNTTNPHPIDLDLGTPNILYGGEGINEEDPDGFNLSNNQSAGNAVIIQTPGYPVANDYTASDSLVYTFSEPVFLESLLALDIENPQIQSGAGVFMYGADGTQLGFVPFNTPPGEDNNLEDVLLKTAGVKKVVVYFGSTIPSSGGVARMCFVKIPGPAIVEDCSEVTLTFTESSTDVDDCTTEVVRVYSAVDACGNEALDACTQVVTIQADGIRPDVMCPPDITIGCDDPLPPPNPDDVVVTDDCSEDGVTVEWLFDIVEGSGCGQVVRRVYRAVDGCGNAARCVQFITREEVLELNAQLLLSAPYMVADDTMRTTINHLLPNSQPYSAEPYYYGGSEYVGTLPADIVDWILVELRDKSTQAMVAQRAALLRSDGQLVDLDGASNVLFYMPEDHYYVSFHHRNHLDIMTSTTIDFTSGVGTVNCKGDPSGQTEVEPGVYAMYKGDVNGDHLVKYNGSNNDRVAILNAVGVTTPNNILNNVYHPADVNMDGQVKYNGANNDRNAVLSTVGLLTPSNIIVGQLY